MNLTKIGDFLKRSKIPIDILDNDEYKRVTIRINHNGVSLRDTETGKKIGTKKQFILKSGQFIVSKIDARYGAFGIAPDEVDGAIITGNFWAYDVDFSKLNIEWFNQFTNSPDFYNLCERASAGITHRKYLNETFFLNYEIMLPSVEEQLIQIEKIKKQKVSFGELTSELTHQLDLIKQLRQAFLREAMQGKLVKSTNIKETGQQLLSKIKAEKAQLIAVKKLKKEKELPPITEDEIPFEIPENWAWCRLGEISSIVRGGSPRPAGDPKYYDGDIPFLKVGDLTGYEGKYCNTYTHTIKKEGLYKTRYVEANTLMLTNSGATLGVPRICTFPTTFNDGIAAFLGIDNLNKEFLFYFLREKSDYFLKEASRGQGQPNLNTDIIGSTLIPLPPLHEQEQIVTKLEELMAFCDGLEQSIKESQGYNEKLLQQVLREVLKGNSIVNE
jgi:type I restriction enzyme S subunit